jgi:CO/xanthine dehydrogenase FAD-binding subunit
MQDGTVSVVSPATLREALRLLAEGGDAARPLAGGTDAMV